MGKFVLFSLNLVFLFAYKLFFGGDVEVTQTFPQEVTAGDKFNVEILIQKGEQEGFAKWQQELPEGFTATSIESEGATFSFKNNTVKLIWMALPEAENFSISYQVEADSTMKGSFDIDGKFSYIEENERKDVTSAPSSITVFNPWMKKAPKQAVDTAAPAAIAEKKMLSAKVSNTRDVDVERSIKLLEAGKYLVTLTIEKGDFKSFGKVEEYIPTGYTASELESAEGQFSYDDQLLKILWMAMPMQDTIVVTYEMESLGDELDSATVHGVFSFLRRDESVQLAMKGTRFPNTYGAPQQVYASTSSSEEVKEADVPEKTETPKVDTTAVVAAETPRTEEKQEKLQEEITSIPDPETEVRYRVQIAAAKREVGKTYFEQRHGIMQEITIDYHGSWFKYMIGSFGVYKQARDRRNEIWADDNKIDDAFVTAYNSGERISVQEALMITKQKWYQ